MANETLWCNSFDSTSTAWTEVGGSPYLDDGDSDYVWDWHLGYDERYFGFENSGVGAGAINSVTLYLEVQTAGGAGLEEEIRVYVNDGAADNDMGTVSCNEGAYQYETVDCTAVLNTWAKIDATELWLETEAAGWGRYCRRAYLYIDYTPAGGVSIPVAMHHYGHHINKIIRG